MLMELSKPIGKKEVTSLAANSLNSISGLIKLCLYTGEVGFRAAWITEIVAHTFPAQFDEHVDEFVEAYIILKNQSAQRHFTKIFMELTNGKRIQIHRLLPAVETIIETTFEWMINPQTPVAVKVNCMDVLYNLKETDRWIADELRAHIEFQLKDGSAALQSRGKKVLKKLSRRKRKF